MAIFLINLGVGLNYEIDHHNNINIVESGINHQNPNHSECNPINIKYYEVTCIGKLCINDFCVQLNWIR